MMAGGFLYALLTTNSHSEKINAVVGVTVMIDSSVTAIAASASSQPDAS